ncbi:hypothetical protein DCC39_05505 [Pueribacillus theae]|uniref:Uncharacterized protein n=1 Tax=Pueribacillus theae TaxID=2171751 RepID=A0A2U1K4M6_9BACI|nr:hypothetical protein [Pueribacillus theae]PWA12471.1 hypothetical protein DCC39_05505 [Pueribacillus theae]
MFIEEIINFFFQNIFFVLVILFGISRFFKRAVSSTEQKERKAGPPPLPPVAKPFFEKKVEKEEHNKPQTDFAEEVEELDGVKTESDEFAIPIPSVDIGETIELPSMKRKWENKNERLASVSHKGTFHAPTHRQVVDGIVWAEILGPPRSRKPYDYRRRRY